jgi:hypothetical protein
MYAASGGDRPQQEKPDMMYDLSIPPPPFGLVVLGRHGTKFKVRIGKLTKIVDREKVLQWAAERRAAGGQVQTSPYL